MAAIVSLQITPSIDGRLRYGDAPEPSADVTASQSVPNDLDNPTGTAFSLAAAGYFSGTQLGLGTYSFIATNGALAALGLAFTAGSISGSAPTIGSVTGKFRWTNGSDANDFRDTNEFSISFIVPSFADTTAPTQVIGVTASRSGGNIIVEHYPSSDPHDGVSAGSGIDRYEVVYDGLVVHTADSVAAEPSPEWGAVDIGSLSSPGESTRNGAGGTARSSGYIGENTAPNQGVDKFHAARYALVSGDFRLSVQVNSIVQGNASTSLKFGLMLRDTLDPGSPFIFGQFRAGGAIRLESRAVQGGNRLTQGSGTIAMGGFGLLERIGNTVNFYASSGGNDLGLVASVTRADIPQSFYVMLAICGTSETEAAEATYDNFSLTTGSKITHTFASTATGPFTVRAVDAGENIGAESVGISVDLVTTSGLFPGTSLKLFPGYMLTSFENTGAAQWESYWQAFFTASPNRKASYRPPGVYGIIKARFWMFRFYTNQSVRPTNPLDHADPGYNWGPLDAILAINAVQNEGAKVGIDIGDVRDSFNTFPAWLVNAPYNGVFIDNLGRRQPKYYRYSGPDLRSPPQSNVGASPPILDEYVAFHSALHDHLVATGNIDKIAWVGVGEVFTQQPLKESDNTTPLADYNETAFFHGTGLRYKLIGEVWAQSGVFLSASSQLTSTKKTINWLYMQDPVVGLGYPDLKMNNTQSLTGDSRFDDLNGVHQVNARQLFENNEDIGIRTQLYLTPGVPNPYGAEGVTIPLTPTEIVWALSGAPKGINKNAGLGGTGDDPPGPWPVHIIGVPMSEMGGSFPALSDWHAAFDRLGPPGTFAFPAWPEEFVP